jgi:hypothetical protein
MESGLVSRFLLVEPPELQREGWIEAEVDPQLKTRCLEVVEELRQLEGSPVDEDDFERKPVHLSFTTSGKAAFVDWCRFHQSVQDDTFALSGPLTAKLKSMPARVGLVLTSFDELRGTGPSTDQTGSTLRAFRLVGRLLSSFGTKSHRLYSTFGTGRLDANTRKVLQLVEAAGGEITPRTLSQKNRQFSTRRNWQRLSSTNLSRTDAGVWETRQASEWWSRLEGVCPEVRTGVEANDFVFTGRRKSESRSESGLRPRAYTEVYARRHVNDRRRAYHSETFRPVCRRVSSGF